MKEIYGRVAGGDITYSDTQKLPPVTFSHKNHLNAKLVCAECHNEIFHMKKGAAKKTDVHAMTMKNFEQGKYCGACHNGKKVFAVTGNCGNCHKST